MSAAHLPNPEPPAESVVWVLEELRAARGEYREAARVLSLLQLPGAFGGHRTSIFRVQREIELAVAEHRLHRWAEVVRSYEARARRLGLRVS